MLTLSFSIVIVGLSQYSYTAKLALEISKVCKRHVVIAMLCT